MQLFVLVLALTIFVHDALQEPAAARQIGPYVATALFMSAVALAFLYWAICRRTLTRLDTSAGAALRTLDLATATYRYLVLAWILDRHFIGDLRQVRRLLGDLVILDELIVLAAPLAMMVWGWWAYYPIDLRLRQAPLIRHLDEGIPVAPLWSRKQFIISHLRHQVALILIPILALMAWNEILQRSLPWEDPNEALQHRTLLMFVGAGVVFLLTPVVIRHIWDTIPLPAGPLRDQLTGMCQRYRVGVRQLLMWRTFGCVINAAVMGAVAPVRYILLTDALLERLPQEHVEAVMAHEIAHVRWHHMFWLMMAAAAAMCAVMVFWTGLVTVAIGLDGSSMVPVTWC